MCSMRSTARPSRDRGQLRPYPRVSCDPTRARGQLRPYPPEFYGRVNVFYPYQGSAATLPDLSVKNPTGFLHYFPVWRFYGLRFLVVCLSFLALGSWQPMLSMVQVQVQHYFYQNVPRPLGNPCFQWFRSKYNIVFIKNIPFIKILPPLGRLCFQAQHSFHQKHSVYQHSPPPRWQPMLSSTTFLYQKHSICQNFTPPSLAAHAFKYNIPVSKTFHLSKFYPPLLGSPCLQVQHSFIKNIPFIKTFPPPPSWQPMLSMRSSATLPDPSPVGSPCFKVQHSFYQKHSFYPKFTSPPLAAHAFKYNIPFIKNTPFIKNFPALLGSPCFQWFRLPGVICDPTWPKSRGQPMLSSTTFLLSKISPPFLAAHAFNDSSYQGSSATLPDLSVKNPPGFYTISRFEGFMVYGFLPTHAFNDSGSSTTLLLSKTFLLSKISPPSWQPMLSMIQITRGHLRP